MNIIGVIAYQGHDSTAALICDGELKGAISEERFSRIKGDSSFPFQAIESLLHDYNLSIQEIDQIVFAWNPYESLFGHIKLLFSKYFWSSFSFKYIFSKRSFSGEKSRFQKFWDMVTVGRLIKKRFGYLPKLKFASHHLCHSSVAYIQSGYDEALSVVADGSGETSTVSVYEVSNGKHSLIYHLDFPHSLGIFYAAITQYLGFRPDQDEYKVMGLASYGQQSKYCELLSQIFTVEPFSLDMNYFSHHSSADIFFSKKLVELLGPRFDQVFQTKANIAFAAQKGLLVMMQSILETVQKLNGKNKNICFSGGVFQNCVLNENIRKSGLFSNYFFSPLCADSGTAVGAGFLISKNQCAGDKFESLYQGPKFKSEEVEALLKSRGISYKKAKNLSEEVADLLAAGKVIAWFQGRAELGPRALGARSILADPRKAKMQDIINEKVKKRELFRPFAPSILAEKYELYFEKRENQQDLHYMIETVQAQEDKKRLIPAVVHIDGSSRVQIVTKDSNKKYHDLIESFYQKTGVPVLLNTSFNMSEEPIVNDPESALNCFIKSGLDVLIMEDIITFAYQ